MRRRRAALSVAAELRVSDRGGSWSGLRSRTVLPTESGDGDKCSARSQRRENDAPTAGVRQRAVAIAEARGRRAPVERRIRRTRFTKPSGSRRSAASRRSACAVASRRQRPSGPERRRANAPALSRRAAARRRSRRGAVIDAGRSPRRAAPTGRTRNACRRLPAIRGAPSRGRRSRSLIRHPELQKSRSVVLATLAMLKRRVAHRHRPRHRKQRPHQQSRG